MIDHPHVTSADMATLEALLDRYEAGTIMSALTCIAAEKAEHVRSNWQDKALAEAWDKTAHAFDGLAARFARWKAKAR